MIRSASVCTVPSRHINIIPPRSCRLLAARWESLSLVMLPCGGRFYRLAAVFFRTSHRDWSPTRHPGSKPPRLRMAALSSVYLFQARPPRHIRYDSKRSRTYQQVARFWARSRRRSAPHRRGQFPASPRNLSLSQLESKRAAFFVLYIHIAPFRRTCTEEHRN
jgi:hypothetical protein